MSQKQQNTPSRRRHIWLVGFMGAGKSSVGALLAERLGIPWVDTDQLIIMDEGRTIEDMVHRHGWGYFRCKERMTCMRCAYGARAVISTGGGVPIHSYAISEMRRTGIVIHLDINVSEAWARVQGSGRPLAAKYEDFRQRYDERDAVYRQADHQVDGSQNLRDVVEGCLLSIGHDAPPSLTVRS